MYFFNCGIEERKLPSLPPQSSGFPFCLLKRDYGPEKAAGGSLISTFPRCSLILPSGKNKIQGSFPIEKPQLLVAVRSVRHFTNSSQEIEKD